MTATEVEGAVRAGAEGAVTRRVDPARLLRGTRRSRALEPNHFRRAVRQQAGIGEVPQATDRFTSQAWRAGRVVAIGWTRGRAPAMFGPVDLRRTPTVEDVVLRFPREAQVEGMVTGAGGTTISGATIFLTGTGPISEQRIAGADLHMRKSGGQGFLIFADTRTDKRGQFKLGGLPADLPLRIVALHPSYQPGRSDVLSLREGETSSGFSVSLGARRER